jgi:cytochrome c oxidase subunit 2
MQSLGPKQAAAAPADSVQTASAGAKLQASQRPAKPGAKPAGQDSAATQQAAAPADPAYAAGEKLFMTKGCVGCHSLQAVNAPKGMIGPNLANVGARSYIGAGSFQNTDENLSHWIQNPQAMKKGVLMPNLGVTPDEAKSLVAFLRAHK